MTELGSSIRVLCVDDDADFVELTKAFLERDTGDFSVYTETSVEDGLQRLGRGDIDCVVSDYQMLGQDGLDFLSAVRDKHGDLPFVLFTGKGSEEIAGEAISSGVSDYLQKEGGTDQFTVLANRLRNLVRQSRVQSDLETRVSQQQIVADLGLRALKGTDLPDLFDEAVTRLTEALDTDYAKVLEWDHTANNLTLVAGVGWQDGLVGSATVDGGADSQAGYTLQTDEPVIVENLGEEDRFTGPPLLVDHDVISGVSVVIEGGDEPWGVLGTHTTTHRNFTPEDAHFVQSIANVLAGAIERREYENSLAATEAQYRAVTETATDVIVSINKESIIQYVNPAVERVFGYTPGDLVGESLTKLMPEEYRDRHLEALTGYVETGEPTVDWEMVEFPGVHRDGHRIDLSISFGEFTLNDEARFTGVIRNITDRVESEKRFRAVFDKAFDGFAIANNRGEIIEANSSAAEIFGVSEQELLGRSIEDFAAENFDFEEAWHQFQESEQERGTFPLARPDGTSRVVEYAATTDIVPGEHLSILRDITEQSKHQQALEASEARYRTLMEDVLDTSRVGTIILDSDFEVVWINQAIEEYFGIDRESMIGEDKRTLINEQIKEVFADSEMFAETVLATYNDNASSEQFECKVLPDEHRERRWLEHWSHPITSGLFDGGRIEHYTDITQRKDLEDELENTLERYQTLVEQNVAGIYIFRDEQFQYVNPVFCEIFGYTEDELLSMNIFNVVPPVAHDELKENIQRCLSGAVDVVEDTLPIVRSDGERRIVRASGTRIDLEGNPAILGTIIDITEQRELEESLKHERELLEQILNTSPVGIILLNTDGEIERANQRAEEVLGLSESEITDLTYDDPAWKIVDHDGNQIPSEELPFARVMATGEPVIGYEHAIEWPDGTTRWLSINATPLRRNSTEISRVIAVILDITEQRKFEQRLRRQNDRLEKFASIVSHDLRNPLNVVSGSLELAGETGAPEHFERGRRAIDRMEHLIDDLLTLARHGEVVSEMEPVDLAGLAEACWRNVETRDASISIETDAVIQADESRLQQLLENLIRNAVEHGGDGVSVTIGDLDGGFVVEDDGPGIPSDVRKKVFESGYSTSDTGTGFGLAIVHEIAEAHEWTVNITDARDGGARFEITGVTVSE